MDTVSAALKMMGGKALIDRFQIVTEGDGGDIVGEEIASKVKAAAMYFNKVFVKGDATADVNGFDGLEKRLSGAQVLSAGDTAGGDVLTLDALDELIDTVGSPDHLLMNATMRRKVNNLMRAQGQAFEWVDSGLEN